MGYSHAGEVAEATSEPEGGWEASALTPDNAHALLRLDDPEQQLALAEEIQAKGLSVKETRQRVRELLCKEFRWRLVPVRLSLETY